MVATSFLWVKLPTTPPVMVSTNLIVTCAKVSFGSDATVEAPATQQPMIGEKLIGR